ncbi:MAG: D-alanyl-D-alanine carboxypeptidase, partial [Clostridiales bacterium]|nr:D-alanyl-D-alanine carboxypeptidase [Clostridiales bacterium]
MKKIFNAILIAFVMMLLFTPTPNISSAEQLSSAKAMCVIDCQTNRKLYSDNENIKLPMASTTKIVTALTVLQNCTELDKEFEVNNRAVGIEGTSIYLKYGEKMTVRELLYGMMLPSGNDAATALAYHVSNDMQDFCDLMQQTANKCGAYNSSFANPHGLDAPNHYTTAYDLALITKEALNNPTFKEIVTTKNTRIKGSVVGEYRYLKNKNKLLNTLEGCIGVKTGFTNKAGRCLVSACDRDGFKTVCVVLNDGPMFEDSEKLLNMAYDNYSQYTILPMYKIVRELSVENGLKPSVKTYTKKQIKYTLTNDEYERLEYRYDLPNCLNAPLEQDQIVGKVEIYLDNHLLFSEKSILW